jgi:hypothetical protein
MFEALFILTTIDTGTRVGRFLVQEFLGYAFPKFEKTAWLPGTVLSTLVVVGAWAYFILTGSVSQIWPMFGIANQLLAAVALAVGTTVILKSGRRKAALATLLRWPSCRSPRSTPGSSRSATTSCRSRASPGWRSPAARRGTHGDPDRLRARDSGRVRGSGSGSLRGPPLAAELAAAPAGDGRTCRAAAADAPLSSWRGDRRSELFLVSS